MRRFRFRLERVLANDRRREQVARLELAATLNAKADIEARLADLRARRAALGVEIAPGSECAVVDLVITDQERCDLERRAGDWQREIEWLEGIAAEQRAALVEIGRRVKLLERLRERALLEHRKLARRAAAKVLDDHTTAAGLKLAPAAEGERRCV